MNWTLLLALLLSSAPSWGQSSQTMTQIQAHTQLLNSGQGDVARSIRFASSAEVQLSMRSNHAAIERGIQSLAQGNLSSEARRAAYTSIANAAGRLSAYQGLVNALNSRLGATVVAERMRTQMGGNSPLQMSQRVHNFVNRYNQARTNPSDFIRYLRSQFGRPARAVTPRPRGGPPGTNVPDVLGGSVNP